MAAVEIFLNIWLFYFYKIFLLKNSSNKIKAIWKN